jgi:altronate hydrolase
MYTRMEEDMDVDAGAMLSAGVTLEAKGREIYDLLLRVASGETTKSEAQGLGDFEFVPWQIGATM